MRRLRRTANGGRTATAVVRVTAGICSGRGPFLTFRAAGLVGSPHPGKGFPLSKG